MNSHLDSETKVLESPQDHKDELRLWLRLLTCTNLVEAAIRKRLEHSFSRDVVVKREPIDAEVVAHVGAGLIMRFSHAGRCATGSDCIATDVEVKSDQLLQVASKFPVSEEMVREQLSRLGDTPFELRDIGGSFFDVCDGTTNRAAEPYSQAAERL